MDGNGEFDFWVISEVFGDILEDFWRTFEEFSRNWFVVRRLRTSGIPAFVVGNFQEAKTLHNK